MVCYTLKKCKKWSSGEINGKRISDVTLSQVNYMVTLSQVNNTKEPAIT
jgi:hypothetical protein